MNFETELQVDVTYLGIITHLPVEVEYTCTPTWAWQTQVVNGEPLIEILDSDVARISVKHFGVDITNSLTEKQYETIIGECQEHYRKL